MNNAKKMTIVEKWEEHRKKLKGAELPYIPYLSEELCIYEEITEEIESWRLKLFNNGSDTID